MGEIYEIYDGGDEVDRFEVRDLRVKTRFAIDNVFYDEFTPIFGPTLSMVYVALVRHANKEQKTWPSQNRIAAQLGLSRKWVGMQLQILQYFNLIRKVRLGKMCNNRYYLLDEKCWRRDFDAMVAGLHEAIKFHAKKTTKNTDHKVTGTQFPSLIRTLVDIRVIRNSHQMLLEFLSNSKDKQVRINKKGQGRLKVKKTSKRTSAPPDEIHIGEGTKTRSFFDPNKNAVVTEHYD